MVGSGPAVLMRYALACYVEFGCGGCDAACSGKFCSVPAV